MTESDIVEVKPSIPMVPIEDLKKLTTYVNEVKKALMTEGVDYIIQGKNQYTARSGFAKLAQGFNLSDEILEKEELTRDNDFYGWRFVVRVYNDYGRQATGVGACTVDEPNLRHHKDRPYHDVYSIAYTRAWNRAVSNFVGSADVSAEEMSIGPDFKGKPTTPAKANVKSIKIIDPIKRSSVINSPYWDLRDELNRSDEAWSDANEITLRWLYEAGLGKDSVEIKVDSIKITVKAVKGLPVDVLSELDSLLINNGFTSSRQGWRLNKKDVTG